MSISSADLQILHAIGDEQRRDGCSCCGAKITNIAYSGDCWNTQRRTYACGAETSWYTPSRFAPSVSGCPHKEAPQEGVTELMPWRVVERVAAQINGYGGEQTTIEEISNLTEDQAAWRLKQAASEAHARMEIRRRQRDAEYAELEAKRKSRANQ